MRTGLESGERILLDSSVLFPNVLRDTLLTLAEHDLFEPQWSAAILAEVRRNVIAKRGVSAAAIDRTIALMSSAFEYALVEGWEPLVETLRLPDPDDRHVLAAAIAGGAGSIVTENLRHFPISELRTYRVTAVDADHFLMDLFGDESTTILTALACQAARYRRPALDLEGLLARLAKAGTPGFAKQVADEITHA